MPDTIIHVKTTVTAAAAGQRIRKWIMNHYRQVVTSRENAHQAFKRGEITVNGQISEETRILQEDDRVEIHYNKTQEQLMKLKDVVLDIGYQDDQLAIIWKEPGMNFNLVEQAARYQFTLDQVWFPYVLQKAASGWLLMAKTSDAKEKLNTRYRNDEIRLGMIVLCHGHFPSTICDNDDTDGTAAASLDDTEETETDLEKESAPTPKSSTLFRSFDVTSVTRSNNADSISTVALDLHTPWGSASVRRFFFHHGHPIIGNSAATRPIKTHRDKGLYMTLHSLVMDTLNDDDKIQLHRPEPEKFKLIRDREHRFWQRACDRRLEELTQAGLEGGQHVESYGKEPLAYILGEKMFYGQRFEIDKTCLIPRPSTETLVDAALAVTPRQRILDLGTGCGNLLLSILCHTPDAVGWGVDISSGALDKATANRDRLDLTDRAHFVLKDMALLTLDDLGDCPVDLIVCNPPYLATPSDQQRAATQQDLALAFEPSEALYAGDDGMAWYVALNDLAARWLAPRGKVVLECGKGMIDRIKLIWAPHWVVVETRKDKQGWDRCLVLERAV